MFEFGYSKGDSPSAVVAFQTQLLRFLLVQVSLAVIYTNLDPILVSCSLRRHKAFRDIPQNELRVSLEGVSEPSTAWSLKGDDVTRL